MQCHIKNTQNHRRQLHQQVILPAGGIDGHADHNGKYQTVDHTGQTKFQRPACPVQRGIDQDHQPQHYKNLGVDHPDMSLTVSQHIPQRQDQVGDGSTGNQRPGFRQTVIRHIIDKNKDHLQCQCQEQKDPANFLKTSCLLFYIRISDCTFCRFFLFFFQRKYTVTQRADLGIIQNADSAAFTFIHFRPPLFVIDSICLYRHLKPFPTQIFEKYFLHRGVF